MSHLASEQIAGLTQAVREREYAQRLLREVERLQRVVFHANTRADWGQVGHTSEQILIAEVVARHHGRVEGLLEALKSIEASGTPWDAAVHELASRIHSYYTTPLGVVMRQDLFGDEAVFLTPEAYDWTERARETADETGAS